MVDFATPLRHLCDDPEKLRGLIKSAAQAPAAWRVLELAAGGKYIAAFPLAVFPDLAACTMLHDPRAGAWCAWVEYDRRKFLLSYDSEPGEWIQLGAAHSAAVDAALGAVLSNYCSRPAPAARIL